MLVTASKVMAVKIDEREEAVHALLPGMNCGVCGFAGCDGYAAALMGGAGTNLCLPGGSAISVKISEMMGVGHEDVVSMIAVVHCRGECAVRRDKMEYAGIKTCTAAKQLFSGPRACIYGCIGYGDCVSACPNGAIRIVNGIVKTDASACFGCGLCEKTCPNMVITVQGASARTLVTCSNLEKGAQVRKLCELGCIACRKCERECPTGAIAVAENLAVIDYCICDGCGHCVEICPVGCLQSK